MARPQNDEEYGDKLADDRAVNVRLGKNLRTMRLKSKTPAGDSVTFEWLAKVTALHHGSIRRFEKGESGMTVATLARLKDALGCSWEALLDGCGSKVVKERIVHFRNPGWLIDASGVLGEPALPRGLPRWGRFSG